MMIEPETIRVSPVEDELEALARDIARFGDIPCEVITSDQFVTVVLNAGRPEFWDRARFSSVSDALWYLRGVSDGLRAVGQWRR